MIPLLYALISGKYITFHSSISLFTYKKLCYTVLTKFGFPGGSYELSISDALYFLPPAHYNQTVSAPSLFLPSPFSCSWREFCSRYAFTDASFLTEEILRTFYTAAARKFPLLLTVNYSLIYASVPTPEGLFVVGPVRFSSSASLKTALTASKMPKDFPETAALCDFTDFADCVLLIYNSFQENFLNPGYPSFPKCCSLDFSGGNTAKAGWPDFS